MLTHPRTTDVVGIAVDLIGLFFVPTPWTPTCRVQVKHWLHTISIFLTTLA